MSNELSLSVVLQHTKNPKFPYNPGTIQVDQSGQGVFSSTIEIGTAEEDVTFPDITTPGLCILYNLDATNYVEWGKKDVIAAMQAIGKLEPADFPAIFRYDPGATLRMKANTAPCKVQVTVYED